VRQEKIKIVAKAYQVLYSDLYPHVARLPWSGSRFTLRDPVGRILGVGLISFTGAGLERNDCMI
jgi:hypothetical protein